MYFSFCIFDYKTDKNSGRLVSNQYFTVNYLKLTDSVKKDYSRKDSFVVLMCLSGCFVVKYQETFLSVEKGESILIPAILNKLELIAEKKTELLEVYI